MKKRKILLLNPPGDKLYLRDYYCSHTSKARYYWHPYDLLVQSGFLYPYHEVFVLDANLLRLSPAKTLRKILELDIDTVFFLTGAVSWRADFSFIAQLISTIPYKLTVISTGDILLHRGIEIMEKYPWLDAILLDFTTDAVQRYLELLDEISLSSSIKRMPIIESLIYRINGNIITAPQPSADYKKIPEFVLPLPRYELFPWRAYRIPHGKTKPFASTITNFGCPFKCSFCIGSSLPFKLRKISNIIEELIYLKERFNLSEVWIKDLTFGAHRAHTLEFCTELIKSKLNISWVCLSRVDVVDEELLIKMKEAGCHTIQFGVETASNELLSKYNKGIEPVRALYIFNLCRKLGIRTLAHFMLGLPGETEESIYKTVEFAKVLNPDFVSFNIATPRIGTTMRQEAIEKGYTDPEIDVLDNSVAFPVINTPMLSAKRLWELRNWAIRSFHLRPGYILSRLFKVRSIYELETLFLDGFSLIQSSWSTGQ